MTPRANRARRTIVTLFFTALVMAGLPMPASAALPGRVTDIGDMFLVEQDGDWFCRTNGTNINNAHCPARNSKQAAEQMIDYLKTSPSAPPSLLRVGKARNDCQNNAPAGPNCTTGVPPTPAYPCPGVINQVPYTSLAPYCALKTMRDRFGINLGVIVGAVEESSGGAGRLTRDIAWQACEIRKADSNGLYNFLFLDEAKSLGNRIVEVVEHVNKGEVHQNNAWVPCGAPNRGWKVITNDNGWDSKTDGHTLDTLAWGHAKHLELLSGNGWQQAANQAANYQIPALTAGDDKFLDEVRKVDLSQPNRKTIAVLRLEVSNGTSKFAQLSKTTQCALLRRWSRGQSYNSLRYAFIYPFYTHSTGSFVTYDSVEKKTFLRMMELMDMYGTPGEQDGPLTQPCPSA